MGRRVAARRTIASRITGRRRHIAGIAAAAVLSLGVSLSACAALNPGRSSGGSATSPGAEAGATSGQPTVHPHSGTPVPTPIPSESPLPLPLPLPFQDRGVDPAEPGGSVDPGADAPDGAGPPTAAAPSSTPRPADPEDPAGSSGLTADDETTLRGYAADTWSSMDAMLVPETGLVADHVDADLGARAPYTSPTNIGGYLWSVVVARDLGVITPHDAVVRLHSTLTTLASLERHSPSGMFYNWYSPDSAAKLTVWPDDDEVITPFLSTVDNGWLAAALRVVAAAEPAVADEARTLSASMDFSWFLDDDADGAGLMRVGFWDERPSDECSTRQGRIFVSCAHYDTVASEARMAGYVGIATGRLPDSVIVAPSRTGPVATRGRDWMRAVDVATRDYGGISVRESTYDDDGTDIVPSWGGGLFEELMPDLFVPEAQWGPRSWALNHAATVAAQERRAVGGGDGAGDPVGGAPVPGVWGVSPAADPAGGYGEFGIDELSIRSTLADAGLLEPIGPTPGAERPGTSAGPAPDGTESIGVVTPHASFLALPYDPRGAMENLRRLSERFDVYGPGGFADAVDADTGLVARTHLSLDQSMILAAIGNAVDEDLVKRYFVDDAFEERVRPLVEQQVFGAAVG